MTDFSYTDLQRMMSTTSGGKFNLGSYYDQVASLVGGTAFSGISQSLQTLLSGSSPDQKAQAICTMAMKTISIFADLSTDDNSVAVKTDKKHAKDITEKSNETDELFKSLNSSLEGIFSICEENKGKIENAIKTIEELGGDKGKIAEAQQELEENIKKIEENKAILNNGISSPEEKKKALSAILEAAGAINSIVIMVNDYQKTISDNQSIVTESAGIVDEASTEMSAIVQDGVNSIKEKIEKVVELNTKNAEIQTESFTKEALGTKQAAAAATPGAVASGTASELIASSVSKLAAGATLMSTATQGFSALGSLSKDIDSGLQHFVTFAGGIGSYNDGIKDLVGAFDSQIDSMITSIGSWETISSANEQLQAYVNEYTSEMSETGEGSFFEKMSTNISDKNTSIESKDAKEINFKKFEFDTGVFNQKNMPWQ